MTAAPGNPTALTPFQLAVARMFFGLPESAGFLLAGGAGLAAQGLTARPTRGLDLFTAPGAGAVPAALTAVEVAARHQGWAVRRVRDSETFARVVVVGPDESVLVDLAVDATPERPAVLSTAGPTMDPEDLAARKVVALFDRAAARDFADVRDLAETYGPERLLHLAAAIDAGFDVRVFADMLDSVGRFADDELPVADPAALRQFATTWAQHLRGS